MKELSIEEKAKAYDEIIGKAKKELNACGSQDCDAARQIFRFFPELKESEDEKIRKGIIRNLEYLMDRAEGFVKDELKERIAWLEKQVPVDEEKVLIGTRKDVALSIINYLDNNSVGMCLSNMECEDIEDACVNSKWTKLYNYMKKKLEKQGDDNKEYWRGYREGKQEILDKYTELEKQGEQKSAEFKPLFRVGDVIKPKDPVLGEPRIIKGIHPKFGYDTNNGILDFEFEDNWELVEQKPAWSEEDKEMLEDTCRILSNSKECTTSNVRWLISLRPQSHWKPSDEQIKAIKWVMDGDNPENWSVVLKNLYQDLKKLKG